MSSFKILVVVFLVHSAHMKSEKKQVKNRYKNVADLNFTLVPPTLAENSLLTSGPLASYREANKIPF